MIKVNNNTLRYTRLEATQDKRLTRV